MCQIQFFTKNLEWSQGRYGPFGSRLSPKTMLNAKFGKRPICVKNSLPKLKGWFVQKANISYLTYNIMYLTCNIKYFTYSMSYFLYFLSYIKWGILNRVLYTNYIDCLLIIDCLFVWPLLTQPCRRRKPWRCRRRRCWDRPAGPEPAATGARLTIAAINRVARQSIGNQYNWYW